MLTVSSPAPVRSAYWSDIMTYNDIVSLTVIVLGASGIFGGVYAQSEVLTALSALALGWGFGLYSSSKGNHK